MENKETRETKRIEYCLVDKRVPSVSTTASITFNQAIRVLEAFTEGDKYWNWLRKKRHKGYKHRQLAIADN